MEMLLQRVKLDLCSRERWAVLCLYCDVTNGLEIKKALVEQRILNATILDAAKLVSPFHVLCAASKACLEEERSTMKAKTLYMQIIYCLAATNNRSKAIQQFSVGEETKSLLVVTIEDHEGESSQKLDEIGGMIKGVNTSLDQLPTITNVQQIRKYYDITDEELTCSSLEDAVVTKMAVRDVK
ncbi:EKC/KEOPS complex subunit Tprkb-like isoform X2 [Dysidea avara]|uniref:EKC/KEOPS complex subunit Tprkb-like isoform X2 n=1 Tax=Dysidea avara TaxID=196820 RepID=UPI00332C67FD